VTGEARRLAPGRSWLTACALLSSLAIVRPSEAGMSNVPCERPFVYDAAVNVVVLPYESAPGIGSSPELGGRLAGLLQLEALRAIAKFGSVGAVHVAGTRCDPDVVVQKLLGQQPGAEATLRPGNGLVLVWGRLYSHAGSLYVQTFCRLLRSGVEETLDLVAGGQRFSGRLSAQAFACAPRKVTAADLANFERQFYRSTIVRTTPAESASGAPIPPEPVPYWVTEVQQDWMKIESARGEIRGWVRLSGERDPWSLGRWLPELSYVEGMVGYLRHRIATRRREPAPAAWIDAVTRALTEYERSLQPGPETTEGRPLTPSWRTALASAAQLQLRGVLLAGKLEATAQDRAEALSLFERAQTVIPDDADARNLVAMMQMSRALEGGAAGAAVKSTATDLLRALGSDPGNPRLLGNLESAYQVLMAQPGSASSLTAQERQEVTDRLAAIRQIRSRR
jgi:hypothetical protein